VQVQSAGSNEVPPLGGLANPPLLQLQPPSSGSGYGYPPRALPSQQPPLRRLHRSSRLQEGQIGMHGSSELVDVVKL